MTTTREPQSSGTAVRSEAAPAVALGLPVLGSLSPSRAGDFMTCPLLYRLRSIDRLPQRPSPAATRGTVVHGVLERLFDLPPADRTLVAAGALLAPVWDELRAAEPEVMEMFETAEDLQAWLTGAQGLLDTYFAMED
ncbi:MAG: RecB family exonuclease-like protein, partial [Frankiales bacterium]|nr:RecB family exonuclease-like protein [Frankiales bacterium]